MAAGVCARLSADLAVSTTGIAGPGGGSVYKPVGLVYIALADSTGSITVQKFNFQGNREDVQMAASQAALEMIQRYLN
jgi:PncC family amidohydrolase